MQQPFNHALTVRLPARLAAIAALLSVVAAGTPAQAEGQQCLESLQTEYRQSFPRVGHMISSELHALLNERPDDVLLLDVREPGEFDVSHIPGAERLDPSDWARTVVRRLGDRVKGKVVVFYCSVGYRSSKMATAVRDELLIRGAQRVTNLMGGIFAWHNTGRHLVDRHGQSILVHPYSGRWATFIDFDDLARMRRSGAAGIASE